MTLDADLIVDRRILRRKLTFWRAAGALLVIALLFAAFYSAGYEGIGKPHVAKISITGFIGYDRPLLETIKRVEKNDAAKALLIYVDSPGGSTAGSEALYEAIRRVAAKKPVVAQIGTLGASGAYVTAIASDHIIATQTSLVGSIGVLVQWPEFTKLMETVGVKVQEVKTSPLKASPNGFEPASDEAKAALKSLVDDSFAWFKGLVADRRSMSAPELAKVADGRVFTGRQAMGLKLIDELGDEMTARAWLNSTKKIAADLPLRTYEGKRERLPTLFGAFGQALGLLGLPVPGLFAVQENGARLDGLVSVWHP